MAGIIKYCLKSFIAAAFVVLWPATPASCLPKDCTDALKVCRQTYRFDEIYFGEGSNRNEINSSFSCLKRGENNSLWFIINVRSAGELGFLITPDSSADLDWAVYNITNASCDRISTDNSLEVSCNFSEISAYPQEHGKTGPIGAGSTITHGDMNSRPYNKKIPVLAGETYVVAIVSWWTFSMGGFTVDFSLSSADIYDTGTPQITSVGDATCGSDEIEIEFSDHIDCSTLDNSDFSITGPSGNTIPVTGIYSENCSTTTFHYDNHATLKIAPLKFAQGAHKLQVVGQFSNACNNVNVYPSELSFNVAEMPVTIVADRLEACVGSTVHLQAEVKQSSGMAFDWQPAGGLSCPDCSNTDATIDSTTEFTLTVTGSSGCVTVRKITIGAKPSPKVNVLKGDTALCESGSAQLLIEIPGVADPSVEWSPAEGLDRVDVPNPVATPTETTEYTATVTDRQTGCSSKVPVTVRIGKPINPVITSEGMSSPVELCEGSVALLDAGEKDPGNGEEYLKYTWYKDSQLLTDSVRRYLTVTEAGAWSVEVLSAGGCKGTASMDVTLIPFPHHSVDHPVSACTGRSFRFKAVIESSQGGYLMKWLNTAGFTGSDTSAEPEIVLNEEGSYSYILEITDTITLCKAYDTVSVEVHPGFTLDLGSTINACPGEQIGIEASLEGDAADYDYYWQSKGSLTYPDQTDSSRVNLTVYNNDTVTLTARNKNGCLATDSVSVNIPVPAASLSLPSLELSPREKSYAIPLTLAGESDLLRCNPESVIIKLEWDFSIFNPLRATARGTDVDFKREFKLDRRTWETTVVIPKHLFSPAGEVFAEITGDVMLGESDTATLYIKSAQWDQFNVNNNYTNGFIRLKDICREGGPRLLDYTQTFTMSRIWPNPAADLINIELQSNVAQKYYDIRLYNIFGDVISEDLVVTPGTKEARSLCTAGLSPGVYRLVVTNGVFTEHTDVLIIR